MPRGINTLRVDACVPFDSAFPPRLHVLLEMQNLATIGSRLQKYYELAREPSH